MYNVSLIKVEKILIIASTVWNLTSVQEKPEELTLSSKGYSLNAVTLSYVDTCKASIQFEAIFHAL